MDHYNANATFAISLYNLFKRLCSNEAIGKCIKRAPTSFYYVSHQSTGLLVPFFQPLFYA